MRKTLLVQRLSGILPTLGFEEALETSEIFSVAGMMNDTPLIVRRQFRSPHHSISDTGLVGGGHMAKPGEVSLAHNGVLFLDEFPEFRRNELDFLRQPLEDGRVTIARDAIPLTYPARFMLVGAMNPCPCGYSGDPVRPVRLFSTIGYEIPRQDFRTDSGQDRPADLSYYFRLRFERIIG